MPHILGIFSYILFGNSTSVWERGQRFFSNLLRFSLIAAAGTAALEAQWMILFVSALAFAVTFLPAILARNLDLHLPMEFELFLTVFIYAAIFLGEIKSFYAKFWWWDLGLHALSGIALGFTGFVILYTLYQRSRISATAFSIALFSFSFGLALGTVWEIFEFAMDSLFGLNMQKTGLRDTMWDLIVDGLGSFLTASIGFVYIKRYGKKGSFDKFVVRMFKKAADAYKKTA